MKAISITLFGVWMFFSVGADMRSFTDPSGYLHTKVIAAAEKRLGRKIHVKGDISVALYPDIGVHLGDVGLHAPDDMGGGPLIHAKTLTIGVRLWPLIRRQLDVDVVLKSPVLSLRIDKKGRKNWSLRGAKSGAVNAQKTSRLKRALSWFERDAPAKTTVLTSPPASPPIPPNSGSNDPNLLRGAGGNFPTEFRIRQVKITNGRISFQDDITGNSFTTEKFNLIGMQEDAKAPFEAKGNLVWHAQTVRFGLRLPSLLALAEATAAKGPVSADIFAPGGEAHFDGYAHLGDKGLGFVGAIDSHSKHPARVIRWISGGLPKGLPPLDRVSFQGRLEANASHLRFTDSHLIVDGLEVLGHGQVRLAEFNFHGIDRFNIQVKTKRLPDIAATKRVRDDFKDVEILLAQAVGADHMQITGRVKWLAEIVNFKGTLPPSPTLLGQQNLKPDWPITLNLSTAHGFLTLDGELSSIKNAYPRKYRGETSFLSRSPARLLKWLSGNPVDLGGIQQISFAGHLDTDANDFHFTRSTFDVTGLTAHGEIRLKQILASSSGKKPQIRGELQIAHVDLERVFGQQKKPDLSRKVRQKTGHAADGDDQRSSFFDAFSEDPAFSRTGPPPPPRITDRDPAFVPAAKAKPGNTFEKIDLAWLNDLDLDVKIHAKKISYGDIKSGAGIATLSIKDGRAMARLPRLDFYGGRSRGHILVQERQNIPFINFVWGAENIAMTPLLGAVADYDRISGTAKFLFALSGRGTTLDALLTSIDGRGKFKLQDGRISDSRPEARKIADQLRRFGFPAFSKPGGQFVLPYKILHGSFEATDGKLLFKRDRPIRLSGPSASARGHGSIDLQNERLGMKSVVQLGRGAQRGFRLFGTGGLRIPVTISGRFDNPSVKIQASRIKLLSSRNLLQGSRGDAANPATKKIDQSVKEFFETPAQPAP